MLMLQSLLQAMVKMNASDLFLKVDSPPSMRIDGTVQQLDLPPGNADDIQEMAYEIMTPSQRTRFEKEHEMDLAIASGKLGRFRVNVYRQRGTIGMVLRHIPFPNFDFEQLHLPPAVRDLSTRHRGLVLVTGTTGSGKSTTLAAMMNFINKTRQCHILTIEDPIEFLHRDFNSIVSQREVGIDTDTFSEGLRHVLRQSPDVILIGEMRDLETIQIAVQSAETGHLVFSTLHTTDAVQTVDRIINYFPSHIQNQIRMELALTLQGVISQRLLPLAEGKGRVPATEILVVTSTIKKILYEGRTLELRDYIADGGHVGMMTFDQCLLGLFNDGLITLEVAMDNASSPDEFRLAADGITSGVKARGMSGS